MPELNVTVSDGLMRALQSFAEAKREPVAEIVAQALQIESSGDYRVVLPTNVDFLTADLSRDTSADLERAEHDRR